LFGGHASLDWPTEPALALWHGITLWREWRGDGHVLAWTDAELDAVEILLLSDLWAELPLGSGVPFRSWTPEEQAAGIARLEDRELIANGGFTPKGRALRACIEEDTDRLASLPAKTIGEEGLDELERLLGGLRQSILDNGGFPIVGGKLNINTDGTAASGEGSA
jgi:hypothetical protein